MKTLNSPEKKNILVIIAHPDDETLWCGGTLLMHPGHDWFIACLCRKNDRDRGPKFKKALAIYKAKGRMGDLDDGTGKKPLDKNVVRKAVLRLVPKQHFDLVLTHSPDGEYTRNIRHEEIGRTVIELWSEQKISMGELWTFAYEDGFEKYYPQAIKSASIHQTLPKNIWQEKYRLITEVYGFEETSFEARTTPKNEAFWKFEKRVDAQKWLEHEGIQEPD